jgi:SSS family solute:Na+ symporter
MSTLDSLLNSAATIFTIDIYKPYINPDTDSRQEVRIGRFTTIILVIIACVWAPIVSSFEGGLYLFLQLYWGFIQPGIVAAFLFAIIWKKTPPLAALIGMLLNIPIYGFLLWMLPDTAFLHHMAITFIAIVFFILIYTWIKPQKIVSEIPVKFPVQYKLSRSVKIWSILVFLGTLSLYFIFF